MKRARHAERQRHGHRDRMDEAVELPAQDHVRDRDAEDEREQSGFENESLKVCALPESTMR